MGADKLYISDHHFGHENIIDYCQRPFGSVKEMDRYMLALLLEAENQGKAIFHLGDIAWDPKSFLGHGGPFAHPNRHTFIAGNHDRVGEKTYTSYYRQAFGQVIGDSEDWTTNTLVVQDQLDGQPVKVLLSHDPQKDLQGCDYNLYGHHHNNIQTDPNRYLPELQWLLDSKCHINVCVELLDYKPRTLQQLVDLQRQGRQLT